MKLRSLLMAITCQIAFSGLVFGQNPQVNNSGFENWTDLGAAKEEPTDWNSFKTGTGTWAWAAGQQVKRSTVKRPGSTGTYSAVIWANSVLGVIANGNLTTGQINMGSTSPSSSSNYNYTKTSDAAFSETLGGHPDSLVVWVRTKINNSAHQPRIHATIHDTYDLRDPIDANSTPHRVAEATLNYTTTGNVWVRKSIPFVYNGPATSPNYILICITTCKDPGTGTSGDSVYIDDLSLVYNPILTTGVINPLVYNVSPSLGTSVSIPFTLTGTMNPGNIVRAQLSDANGSFANPVVIGTLSTLISGTITGTIPAGTPTGSGYRIRVVSTNYAIVAANNGSDIQINNLSNSISPNTTQNICLNNTGTTLNVTEAPDATSREWKYATTTGGPYTSFSPSETGTSYTPQFSTSGSYYVICQSNFNGVIINSQEVLVKVNEIPTLSASANPPAICSGQNTALSCTGATSFVWNPGNVSGTTVNVSPVTSTTYTVTETSTGCSATASVDVTVNPLPEVLTSANPSTICSGETSSVSASGATTYNWLPGNISGETLSVSPANTTTYTVTGTLSGCSSSATLVVTVNQLPVVSASATPSEICQGNGTSLSASGATSYTWIPGNLTGETVTVSPATTTSYIVIGSLSGCSSFATVDVTVYDQPVSGSLTETPAGGTVCAGTDVSALATAGFGGNGTVEDILEYSYDGGTWMPYVAGTPLTTTGYNTIDIRTYRTSSLSGCNASIPVEVSWTISSPSSLTATNITTTSADLSWTDLNGSSWNIEYGNAGFVQGTGTLISGITSKPYNVTGLTLSTDYSFYVQSNCGSNNTQWTGPYNFTTHGIVDSKTLTVKVYFEGLYNTASGYMNKAHGLTGFEFDGDIADKVTVELHNSLTPDDIAYSFDNLDLNIDGNVTITTLPSTVSDSYYVVIKQRNSIETWSALPVDFSGSAVTYDFSTSLSQAYGNNMKAMSSIFAVYGGDVSSDGTVDGSDLAAVDNASISLLTGYYPEDVNGDGLVDGSDMALIDNNSIAIVHTFRP